MSNTITQEEVEASGASSHFNKDNKGRNRKRTQSLSSNSESDEESDRHDEAKFNDPECDANEYDKDEEESNAEEEPFDQGAWVTTFITAIRNSCVQNEVEIETVVAEFMRQVLFPRQARNNPRGVQVAEEDFPTKNDIMLGVLEDLANSSFQDCLMRNSSKVRKAWTKLTGHVARLPYLTPTESRTEETIKSFNNRKVAHLLFQVLFILPVKFKGIWAGKPTFLDGVPQGWDKLIDRLTTEIQTARQLLKATAIRRDKLLRGEVRCFTQLKLPFHSSKYIISFHIFRETHHLLSQVGSTPVLWSLHLN